MTFDEIEELIRKYLSTGIAVVVILVAPGTGDDSALPRKPEIVAVEPGASPAGSSRSTGEETIGRSTNGDPTSSGRDTPEADTTAPDTPGSVDPDTGNADPPSDRTGAAGTDPDRSPAGETGATGGTGDTGGNGTGAGNGTTGAAETGSGDQGPTKDRTPDTEAAAAGNGATSNDPPAQDPGTGDTATGGTGASSADTGNGAAGDSTAARSTGSGGTAAEVHGWGTPTREDDFSGGADQWDIYEGPGHDGQGNRSASAVSLDGGVLTITGDADGTTAGMAWNPGEKYGRWEGRVRAPAGDPSYHALLLLWPDAEDWPSGGELDFMEISDASRQTTELFLHYGADNSQVQGSVEIDATQWHNWAIEWTPESITAFVDGKEWYRTTDQSLFPPGPMHLCIQLDWFPEGGDVQESSMMVDWVRYYPLDAGTSGGAGDNKPGDNNGGGGPGTADQPADGAAPADEGNGNPDAGESPIREFFRRMFTWG